MTQDHRARSDHHPRLGDEPGTAKSGFRVQLKRQMAGLGYDDQVALVRPAGEPQPLEARTVSGDGSGPLQHLLQFEATHEMPSDAVIYEQIAHNFCYNGVDDAGRNALLRWGWEYQDGDMITQGLTGDLAMLRLRPARREGAPRRPPVLAFRGTESGEDVLDDANPAGVGMYQYTSNEGRIVNILESLRGPVVVTGHSLGGALAEITACQHPSLVESVQSYQAPGIDREMVNRLLDSGEGRRIAAGSRHHFAEGDVVAGAGEAHTPGSMYEYEVDTPGSAPANLALGAGGAIFEAQARHRAMLASGVEGVPEGGSGPGQGAGTATSREATNDPSNALFEGVRRGAGGIARDNSAHARLEHVYAQEWIAIRDAAGSGTFRGQEVNRRIDALALPRGLKDRMRANLRRLYPALTIAAQLDHDGQLPDSLDEFLRQVVPRGQRHLTAQQRARCRRYYRVCGGLVMEGDDLVMPD